MKTRIFGDTPCFEGAKWLRRQPDEKTAWQKCKRGDWMLWALMNSPDGCCLITREESLKLAEFAAEKIKIAVEAAKGTVFQTNVDRCAEVVKECVKILKDGENDYDYGDLAWAEEADCAISNCNDAWQEMDQGDFLKEAANYLRELFPTFPEAK